MAYEKITKADKVALDKILRAMPSDKFRRLTAYIADIVETKIAQGKPVPAETRRALKIVKAHGIGG